MHPRKIIDWGVMSLTDEQVEKFLDGGKKAHDTRTAWYNDPERKAAAVEKSRQTRERNKNFHKLARYMMEAQINDEEELIEELEAHGFEGADYQTAVFWKQLKKAINSSDTEAAKYVRDTAGYKPTETMQVGNLDDKPFEQIDLSKLSTAQLREMIAARRPITEDE